MPSWISWAERQQCGVEEVDHGPARSSAAQPGRAQPVERGVDPGGHDQTIAILISATLRGRAFENRSLVRRFAVGARRRPRRGRTTPARTVVAAFYPLAFAAEQVAGGRRRGADLTPPGAEPHDLELAARDVGRVRDASLVVYVGRGFQPALEEAPRGPGRALARRPRAGGAARGPGDGDGRPACLARPAAIPGDRPRDRRRSRPTVRCRRSGAPTAGARRRVSPRPRPLRAPRARDEPCARSPTSPAATTSSRPAAPGSRRRPSPLRREVERLVREVRRTGATTVFSEPLLSPRLAETVAREAVSRLPCSTRSRA